MPEKRAGGHVKQIVSKRSENQKRLKKEAPLLFKVFDCLMIT
jgi:hypothetical protein